MASVDDFPFDDFNLGKVSDSLLSMIQTAAEMFCRFDDPHFAGELTAVAGGGTVQISDHLANLGEVLASCFPHEDLIRLSRRRLENCEPERRPLIERLIKYLESKKQGCDKPSDWAESHIEWINRVLAERRHAPVAVAVSELLHNPGYSLHRTIKTRHYLSWHEAALEIGIALLSEYAYWLGGSRYRSENELDGDRLKRWVYCWSETNWEEILAGLRQERIILEAALADGGDVTPEDPRVPSRSITAYDDEVKRAAKEDFHPSVDFLEPLSRSIESIIDSAVGKGMLDALRMLFEDLMSSDVYVVFEDHTDPVLSCHSDARPPAWERARHWLLAARLTELCDDFTDRTVTQRDAIDSLWQGLERSPGRQLDADDLNDLELDAYLDTLKSLSLTLRQHTPVTTTTQTPHGAAAGGDDDNRQPPAPAHESQPPAAVRGQLAKVIAKQYGPVIRAIGAAVQQVAGGPVDASLPSDAAPGLQAKERQKEPSAELLTSYALVVDAFQPAKQIYHSFYKAFSFLPPGKTGYKVNHLHFQEAAPAIADASTKLTELISTEYVNRILQGLPHFLHFHNGELWAGPAISDLGRTAGGLDRAVKLDLEIEDGNTVKAFKDFEAAHNRVDSILRTLRANYRFPPRTEIKTPPDAAGGDDDNRQPPAPAHESQPPAVKPADAADGGDGGMRAIRDEFVDDPPVGDTNGQAVSERPKWDGDRSELWFRSRLEKKLRPIANSQIAILDAFEANGWSRHISNPLSNSDKQRLRETISNLNDRCQGIRFLADGRGEGVEWEAVEASSTK